ncbi:MAG: hypothetical protein LC796_02760 [Acidobacteria bacterium]|nr:hypothetical protein [Acidobacteriota bacterium]
MEECRRRAVLIGRIDGEGPSSLRSPFLAAAGFTSGSRAFLKRALVVRNAGAADPAGSVAADA